MTKPITINTAAAWAATVTTIQDGDNATEAVMDVCNTTVADRLGYLKTTVDTKPGLASDNTWTGVNTFNSTMTSTAAVDLSFGASTLDIDSISCGGAVEFGADIGSGLARRVTTGADAATTYSATVDEIRVPTLTANRVYTLDNTPAPRTGAMLRIVRPRTADAFTLTVQREDATSLAVITASAAAWIDFTYTSAWVVSAWGGTLTSVSVLV